MTASNVRKLFVNIPVTNLQRSMEFFSKLGFEFDPQFTDANAACMVVSDAAFVMLLAEPFFKGFTKKQLCDTTSHSETLLAVSADSRSQVDELVKQAFSLGGTPAMDPLDHGFMYGWSFYDLDGHHWEVMWMDANASQEN